MLGCCLDSFFNQSSRRHNPVYIVWWYTAGFWNSAVLSSAGSVVNGFDTVLDKAQKTQKSPANEQFANLKMQCSLKF
jgi:hypothetical protein